MNGLYRVKGAYRSGVSWKMRSNCGATPIDARRLLLFFVLPPFPRRRWPCADDADRFIAIRVYHDEGAPAVRTADRHEALKQTEAAATPMATVFLTSKLVEIEIERRRPEKRFSHS